MDVVVGTAGHIDHGKTALIKALTGVDADRLPEEKQRGITIDLGFAELRSDDLHIGFVDVPGHERFVKNMLAGIGGIDAVMLVISADEGVMPQTREHFSICRLLNIRSGLVVITKSDLADEETLELAHLEAAELVSGSFLEGAPIIDFSAKTLSGLDELRSQLFGCARATSKVRANQITRLPIDRSFTMKGFGAVVTGTLIEGEIRESDELELLPLGRKVRVRGLQTHGTKTTSVKAGQRAAVNIAGIDHSEVERGMSLVEADVLHLTQIIDTEIEVLSDSPKPLRNRQRVRVHIGTQETLARTSVLNESGAITPGETDLVQFRFENPVVALPGDRFIVRSYSPQTTIAGGIVIENLADKHRKKDFDSIRMRLLDLRNAGSDRLRIAAIHIDSAGQRSMTFADLQARTGLEKTALRATIDQLVSNGLIVDAGGAFVARPAFDELKSETVATVGDFHKKESLARGIPLQTIRDTIFEFVPGVVFKNAIASAVEDGTIIVEGETVRLKTHQTDLSDLERSASLAIVDTFRNAGLEVPKLEELLANVASSSGLEPKRVRKLLQLLIDSNELVKVTDEFYFAQSSIESLAVKLKAFAETATDRLIDVATFKELAGVSRKYAIPLLEYFDRIRVTQGPVTNALFRNEKISDGKMARSDNGQLRG